MKDKKVDTDNVTINLNKKLLKEFKIYCVKKDSTMRAYVEIMIHEKMNEKMNEKIIKISLNKKLYIKLNPWCATKGISMNSFVKQTIVEKINAWN